MKTPLLLLLLPCLALLPLACSGDATQTPGSTGKPAPTNDDDHHGKASDRGALTAGKVVCSVTQFGDVGAGKETGFTLTFPKDQPMPQVARCWIGAASGEGSMKSRFVKEGERGLHGHVEAPKELPAGAAVWFQFELDGETTAASLPLQ